MEYENWEDQEQVKKFKPTLHKITFEEYLEWYEANKEKYPFLQSWLA